jgi:hypothetical protein
MDPSQAQPDPDPGTLIERFDQERQAWLHLGDPFSLEMVTHLEEALVALRADNDGLGLIALEKRVDFVRDRGIGLANAILVHRGPCGARSVAWSSLMGLAEKQGLRTLLQFMLALQQPSRSAVVQ